MTEPKRALITGITGQDGLYLAEFLYRNTQQLASTLMGGEVRRLVLRHALFGAVVLSYVVAQNGLAQPFIYFQF